MQLSHQNLLGLTLLCLPLWLGNKGCEPDPLHPVDAGEEQEAEESVEVAPRLGGTGPGARDASAPATPAASDSGILAVRDAAGPAPAARDGGSDAGAITSALRCGTRGGVQCTADEFCDFLAGSQCGALDQGGSCQRKPEICTAIYKPVCGCDGKTYGSACAAHGQGVAVASEGECGKPAPSPKPDAGAGKMCGGIANLQCVTGEFCNHEVAAGGLGCDGIADGSGTCQRIPQACTREYDPVCGCDRRTYATACTAHAASVSVLHTGMCTDVDCKAIGGHPVDGIGPAPKCPAGESDYGAIRYASGQLAIEGTICCVK